MIKVQKLNVVKEIDERRLSEFEKNGYVRVDENASTVYVPRKAASKITEED